MTVRQDHADADHLVIADDFWAATALDEYSNPRFVRRLTRYEPVADATDPLAGPGAVTALRPVSDRFQRSLERRRSERSFGSRPLRQGELERVLAATGRGRDGRRVVPSAGGLDAVATYAICRAVEGPTSGRIVRYDASSHAVAAVCTCPQDEDLAIAFNLVGEPLPALFVVFVAHLGHLRAKYGARGDRFALIETGCAAQTVELRLAADRLAGYQLGGARREVDRWLRLDPGVAHVTGAIACGPPE